MSRAQNYVVRRCVVRRGAAGRCEARRGAALWGAALYSALRCDAAKSHQNVFGRFRRAALVLLETLWPDTLGPSHCYIASFYGPSKLRARTALLNIPASPESLPNYNDVWTTRTGCDSVVGPLGGKRRD